MAIDFDKIKGDKIKEAEELYKKYNILSTQSNPDIRITPENVNDKPITIHLSGSSSVMPIITC